MDWYFGQVAIYLAKLCIYANRQSTWQTRSPRIPRYSRTKISCQVQLGPQFSKCQVNFAKLLEMGCFSSLSFRFGSWQTATNDKEKISNCWRCSYSLHPSSISFCPHGGVDFDHALAFSPQRRPSRSRVGLPQRHPAPLLAFPNGSPSCAPRALLSCAGAGLPQTAPPSLSALAFLTSAFPHCRRLVRKL